MACNVYNTFATRASLVHDITDADCWVENGSADGHVFTTSKYWFFTNKTRNRVEKKLYVCFLFFFVFLI